MSEGGSPGDVLQHAVDLLDEGTDESRRLALLAIHDAIELIMRAYLELPERETGLEMDRDTGHESSDSFLELVNAVDEKVPDRWAGVDLRDVVRFHRDWNRLCDRGSGVTVPRRKVMGCFEMARSLHRRLLGAEVDVTYREWDASLSSFLSLWAEVESKLVAILVRRGVIIYSPRGPMAPSPRSVLEALESAGVLSTDRAEELSALLDLRNGMVHGAPDDTASPTQDQLRALTRISRDLRRLLAEE